MTMRRLFLIFACIVIALCAIPLFAQDAGVAAGDTVKLEYKFVPGDTSDYKMVGDMNVNITSAVQAGEQIPAMNVKMVGITSQHVNKILDNGDAEITYKVKSMKMTMMGSTSNVPVDQMPVMTVTMSKDGRIKSFTGLDQAKSMITGIPILGDGGAQMQYSAFPDKPLAVGDTWTYDIPLSTNGAPIHLEGKMLQIGAKAGDYTVAVYSENLSGDLNFGIDPSKIAGSQAAGVPAMILSGKINARGTSKFSPDLGKLISGTGTIEMQMNMNPQSATGASTDASFAMSMSVQGSYDMFLMPPEKAK